MLKRTYYLDKIRGFYNSNLIKILVGIRRCGKSVILEQIIDELKDNGVDDKHIININFEFIEYEELKDYKKLNSYIKEKVQDKKLYYIFLDEIQNVDRFEDVVNSLRASLKNVSIFITGSNSKLLSEELSTTLSGRYVLINIYPLSYKEYISLTKKDPYDLDNFWDYATWGGLPNRCEFTEEVNIKNYLHSVYDSIMLRDVVERLNLKDITLFNLIIQYLIDTVGREFSCDNLMKYLKNYKTLSTETIYTYIEALCKALLIKKVYRYDVHGKKTLKTLNKYYVTDLGIAQIKHHNTEFKNYLILENIVYNELIMRDYEVYVCKLRNKEIDFIAKKDGKVKYIQVAYSLDDEGVREREYGAYKGIDDNYSKYIITLDKNNYEQDGIKQIYLIDFLMNNNLSK